MAASCNDINALCDERCSQVSLWTCYFQKCALDTGKIWKAAQSSVMFGVCLCVGLVDCMVCSCACLFCAWISCRSCRRRLAWAHCLLISIPICLSPTVMLPTIPTPNHTLALQSTHRHEHRHPHNTQIPPPQCLLSLIMNTEADRIACKCTHVHTHIHRLVRCTGSV